MEHFVTLFDSSFLPSGLCLHASLSQHTPNFTLWIVCMDKKVEEYLTELNLPQVELVPLETAENDRLLSVKKTRSKGEYCWTMTPFAPELVFKLAPEVKRVTYLDADLFFYENPSSFFEEFERSRKEVLITEHGFAPEYAHWEEASGRFCVQFLTFNNSQRAFEVMHWWQNACIEWCYAIIEKDRFGDQKYLNKWPELFGNHVHILAQVHRTLAPWNVNFYMPQYNKKPVFFHFHSFRLVGKRTVRLYEGYRIGKQSLLLYTEYLETLRNNLKLLNSRHMDIPFFAEKISFFMLLRRCRDLIQKTVKYCFLEY